MIKEKSAKISNRSVHTDTLWNREKKQRSCLNLKNEKKIRNILIIDKDAENIIKKTETFISIKWGK